MSDDVAKLKEEIEKLKLEKAALMPTLRTRTPLFKLFQNPNKYLNRIIGLGAWIRQLRSGGGGKFAFLKVSDGTLGGELQVIVDQTVPGFDKLQKGASIFVVGEIVASKGKEQKIEMVASKCDVLGACPQDVYPLAGKNHSLEYLRVQGHLRPRTALLGAVFRVRNVLSYAVHQFFQSQGYQYIHTPLITASDCEGGGEMFQVTTVLDEAGRVKPQALKPDGSVDYSKDFFGSSAYLTVSGQLNAEIMALSLSSVYTFGPTFRAEDSHTSRHLSEFWMIEPEIAFADLNETMDVVVAFLKHCVGAVLENCEADVMTLENFEVKRAPERAKLEAEARAKAKKEKEKAAKASAAKKPKEAFGEDKPKDEATLKLEADIEAQGQKVRAVKTALKEGTATKEEVEAAVAELLALKAKAGGGGGGGNKKKGGGSKSKGKTVKDWRSVPLRERMQLVMEADFPRVSYTDAIEILKKVIADGHDFVDNNVFWGMDLGSEHERYLCEVHFACPIIVYNYPKEIKAFYMRMCDDGKTVGAMDVLVPGVGELMGGSQREERLDHLMGRIKELGLDEAEYSWYLDLRRYGTVVHSGFGLGFERLVCYVTGMENIREAIPFPRYPGHAAF